jgi:spore coat polysaccharide biosynthesis protein SpsF
MIIAFVPCRIKSSRLPGKALQQIHGKASIERCLINALSIPGIDKVVLATSDSYEDEILMQFNLDGRVEVVQGDEEDVLKRFLPVIERDMPEHIIRITGDCPLVSPELGELLIESHLKENADVTYTSSKVALGISFEVIKTSAVKKLIQFFPVTKYSEYLIYYFINNPTLFKINNFQSPEHFIQNWRLTLDEENDLLLLNRIYSYLNVNEEHVTFKQVEQFFEKFPDAATLNIKNEIKYRDNLELVQLLKKQTTLYS